MHIPGSLGRVANAYGVTPVVKSQGSKVEGMSPTSDLRPATDGLRSVLSDEERAYFDQIAALGPITYGRGSKTGLVPEAPRGLRLDVRG